MKACVVLLAVLSLVTSIEMTFELQEHEVQCFHEVIPKDQKITLEYQVEWSVSLLTITLISQYCVFYANWTLYYVFYLVVQSISLQLCEITYYSTITCNVSNTKNFNKFSSNWAFPHKFRDKWEQTWLCCAGAATFLALVKAALVKSDRRRIILHFFETATQSTRSWRCTAYARPSHCDCLLHVLDTSPSLSDRGPSIIVG